MRTLEDEVMTLPVAERLDHALYLIECLTGGADRAEAWLKERWSLTPCEVRVLCALNAVAPMAVSREGLYTAIYGGRTAADLSIINVYVSKLRQKTGLMIRLHRQFGFSLVSPISIPPSAPLDLEARRWSTEDDSELQRMLGTGSDLAAIADELGRTERAVKDRIRRLRCSQLVAA